jgi:hypothetical protein
VTITEEEERCEEEARGAGKRINRDDREAAARNRVDVVLSNPRAAARRIKKMSSLFFMWRAQIGTFYVRVKIRFFGGGGGFSPHFLMIEYHRHTTTGTRTDRISREKTRTWTNTERFWELCTTGWRKD